MLMIASGLLIRSHLLVQEVDAGFQADHVLTAELQLPEDRYETETEIRQAWTELRERIGALPGILSVGAIDQLPVNRGGTYNSPYAAARPPVTDADRMPAERRFASDGYFRVLKIPIASGRAFMRADLPDTPRVVIINKTMAAQFFPDEDPIGEILVLPWEPDVRMEIVGVAGDIRERGLAENVPPIFYMPSGQWAGQRMHLLMRTTGDPLAVTAAVRAAVWGWDTDIPVSAVDTMESRLTTSQAEPRFRMLLIGLFALVALTLSSTGLYGVLSFYVRQSTLELGIRVALGAGPRRLLAMVVGRGMAMAAAGIGIGMLAGFASASAMRSFLFQIEPTDPATFWIGGLCLALVALAASVLPALRATRVDPQSALKLQ